MSKTKLKGYKDIDKNILVAIKNPSHGFYETKIAVPEFSCLGGEEQPDYGRIMITFYASDKIIELKSFKKYLYQFRDTHISYERLINLIYDHLIEVFEPLRLRIVIEFFPRGGISSRLVIDSDWKVRGGQDQYWKDDSDNEWTGTKV